MILIVKFTLFFTTRRRTVMMTLSNFMKTLVRTSLRTRLSSICMFIKRWWNSVILMIFPSSITNQVKNLKVILKMIRSLRSKVTLKVPLSLMSLLMNSLVLIMKREDIWI